MKRCGILFGLMLLCACLVCAQDDSANSSSMNNGNTAQSQTTPTTNDNSAARSQSEQETQDRKDAAVQDENAADAHKTAAKDESTKEGAEQQKVLARMDDAAKDIDQLLAAPDKGIPEDVFAKAKCVAIVPSMIKGGFIFGAEHGRGVASCRLPEGGWSAPAFFVVTGGSWGAQIGAEGVDLVMLVMNDNGMNQLLNAKFKIGAAASASAGPVGRQAAADTSWKMNSEILTYSRARGLFAGATLNGAVVKQDDDAMRGYYGRTLGFRPVLTGQVKDPNPQNVLQATLRKNHAEATNAQAH